MTLKELDGGRVSTAELRGRPSALLFYRGSWCPLCMAQVSEVAGRYRKLRDMGV